MTCRPRIRRIIDSILVDWISQFATGSISFIFFLVILASSVLIISNFWLASLVLQRIDGVGAGEAEAVEDHDDGDDGQYDEGAGGEIDE